MDSKYKKAFDSLNVNDEKKRERSHKILSYIEDSQRKGGAKLNETKFKRPFFKSRRGIALVTAVAVVMCAVGVSVPLILGNNLEYAINALTKTYVDMEGVTAFGVWNAPDETSKEAYISDVSLVNSNASVNKREKSTVADSDGGVSTGEWSDDERYEWESDFDWDPTKSNVLIALNEEGAISEVVYERINGRGQIRQDTLGNVAAVYVSKGFTYVMYVNDQEWEFWKEINFAQEMRLFSGFHCHHELKQTVVIHNETGKVFALKDLIPQVNEQSGAINYTMQIQATREDFLYVRPMYGNGIPQWYEVVYDQATQKLRYEEVISSELSKELTISRTYNVRAVRRDNYGQKYVLVDTDRTNTFSHPRISPTLADLPICARFGNSLLFKKANGIMFGTDGRAYTIEYNKLKVFDENFELKPVEKNLTVVLEGIADEFWYEGDGIEYKLDKGYLYSISGDVWKVGENAFLEKLETLQGSFPRFADDAYVVGDKIIAIVDGDEYAYNHLGKTLCGTVVELNFTSENGQPQAIITPIMEASNMSFSNRRLIAAQDEHPYSKKGFSKYYLITVTDGVVSAEYFGYGKDGGMRGLTKPITEPLKI